jgi:hypothetical protein
MVMPTDTKGFGPELEGKVLRVFFRDGQVTELKLLIFELHENCNIAMVMPGIIYDVIQANRPKDFPDQKTGACWLGRSYKIERFETGVN